MTLKEQVKQYENNGYVLSHDHSFLNGDSGWLRLEHAAKRLFKLFQVNKEEYEQIIPS